MYDAISDIINVIAKLFIDEVIYDNYFQSLSYETNDLLAVYWSIVIVPLVAAIIFHKFWDPIEKGKLRLILTLLASFLVVVGFTYFTLFNNSTIILEIEEFKLNDQIANPYFFVFPYGFVTGIFSTVVFFIITLLTRFISTNNRTIPKITFKKS